MLALSRRRRLECTSLALHAPSPLPFAPPPRCPGNHPIASRASRSGGGSGSPLLWPTHGQRQHEGELLAHSWHSSGGLYSKVSPPAFGRLEVSLVLRRGEGRGR